MLCLFETGNRSSSFVNQVALILTLFAAFYYMYMFTDILTANTISYVNARGS